MPMGCASTNLVSADMTDQLAKVQRYKTSLLPELITHGEKRRNFDLDPVFWVN